MVGNANIIGTLKGVQSSAISVRQSRCAMVRNRNARCLKCADACTSGCISMANGALRIDVSKCVGCGTCATVCPTCALEAHNPSDATLLAACLDARVGGRVAVMCRPCREALSGLAEDGRAAEVVCLGRVDESLIAELVAAGMNDIRLVHGACERCGQQPGLACAHAVATSANAFLEAWDSDARATVSGDIPCWMIADGNTPEVCAQAQAAVDRFFTEVRGNSPIAADAAAPVGSASSYGGYADVLKVMKDGTLPHFVPDRRERLLDALDSLGAPVGKSIATRLWGCVVIDGGKCSSCRMCATFCPTGALSKFDGEDGTFGVEHYPGDCVKCGTCREICPEGAIAILDSVKAAYLTDGSVHRYAMRPRAVKLNDEHQILNTMRANIDGDIFER